MKKIKSLITASAVTLSALLSSVSLFSVPETSALSQVNIMPIGDSITFGLGEDGGYRKYLDYALKTKDISFDMVGPEGKNSDSFTYNGQFCQYDGNHAGYSGFTIKQQYPIPSWGENGLLERLKKKDAVKNAKPDIVLLIIGTNDMTANRNLSDCEKDLHMLIDYILGDMPEGGVIFMGSIPEFTAYGGNAQRVGNYNNTVKKVAESYGDNVRFADVHGSLNGMADMSNDNLHPSGKGYEKMGKFWAEVIEEYLSELDTPDDPDNPQILYSDFENGLSGWQARGGVNVSVTSDTAAEGNASASVTGRTASWNGISYSLSQKRCPAGQLINANAKIMQKTGSPVTFKMTMQYDNNGTAVYDTFAEKTIPSGEWVSLSAYNYKILEGSGPVLYFETDTDLCDFYLDEVSVMKSDGSAPPEEIISGDINKDGIFSAVDVLILQHLLLDIQETQPIDSEAADFNKDGTVNILDLCMIKEALISQNN